MRILFILLFFTLGTFAQRQVTVFFDFDKSDLTAIAQEQLKSVFSNPQLRITKIYGYCDWKGDKTYNDSLSYARVDAVYNFIKEREIKTDSSFEGIGFGKDFPQSKIQAENRKVTITFIEFKEVVEDKELVDAFSSEVLKLEVGQNIKDFIRLAVCSRRKSNAQNRNPRTYLLPDEHGCQ